MAIESKTPPFAEKQFDVSLNYDIYVIPMAEGKPVAGYGYNRGGKRFGANVVHRVKESELGLFKIPDVTGMILDPKLIFKPVEESA
jgi:hypothetical protein